MNSVKPVRGYSEEEAVFEKKYGYVRRSVPVEQATLHILFPLEVYWRNVTFKQKIGERIVNKEGQIYPSFSDIVFPAEYKIEMTDAEKRDKFMIHYARGYVPCPVCGAGVIAKIDNYEIATSNPIKRFTPEVAYEIVVTALSKELAARMKAHVESKHGFKFARVGKERITIVRYTGGEYVMFDTEITTYRCPADGQARILGVYGILDHLVNNHVNTDKTAEVRKFLDNLASTTLKIFGLGKDRIPILGAYRSVFDYRLSERGSGVDTVRVLAKTWFKPWLHAEVVERKDSVDMRIYASIPRPMRMIYHYPIYRYAPPVLSYKSNPNNFMNFVERAEDALRRRGYSTDALEAIVDLVTGPLARTKITPRNAFEIDLETLEDLRAAVDKVGDLARVFLAKESAK